MDPIQKYFSRDKYLHLDNYMSRLAERLVLPGEIVKLPSQGLRYPEGVLSEDVKNGELMVYPMTAFDEVCMRNISEIINGNSISTVFQRCIPQILKPEELFSKDVDALLIYLRKVTYGAHITISHKHDCEKAKYHKYEIPINNFIQQIKYIDPTTVDQIYTVVLPDDSVVSVHPIKFKDAIEIMKSAQDYGSIPLEELKLKIAEATTNIIQSVDGITDKEEIIEWVAKLPAPWAKKISDAVQLGDDWGPATTSTISCKDCEAEISINVPINPLTFFLDS